MNLRNRTAVIMCALGVSLLIFSPVPAAFADGPTPVPVVTVTPSPTDSPTSVSIPSWSNTSDRSSTLTWVGTNATSYLVVVSVNGVKQTPVTTTNQSLDVAIPPGSTASATVTATGPAGSDSATSASFTQPPIASDPPTNVTLSQDTPSSINVSWTAPKYTGGAPVQNYVVSIWQGKKQVYSSLSPKEADSATMLWPESSARYYATVQANTVAGEGSAGTSPTETVGVLDATPVVTPAPTKTIIIVAPGPSKTIISAPSSAAALPPSSVNKNVGQPIDVKSLVTLILLILALLAAIVALVFLLMRDNKRKREYEERQAKLAANNRVQSLETQMLLLGNRIPYQANDAIPISNPVPTPTAEQRAKRASLLASPFPLDLNEPKPPAASIPEPADFVDQEDLEPTHAASFTDLISGVGVAGMHPIGAGAPEDEPSGEPDSDNSNGETSESVSENGVPSDASESEAKESVGPTPTTDNIEYLFGDILDDKPED